MSSFEINIDGYTYQLGYLNPIPGFIKNEMQDLISIAGIKLRLDLYAHVMLLCQFARRYKHLKFQLQIKVI